MKSMYQTLTMTSRTKVLSLYILEPVNSLVASDILLLTKFEKEFEGLEFNKEQSGTSKSGETPVGNFSKKKNW